jgi:hypothetical protein
MDVARWLVVDIAVLHDDHSSSSSSTATYLKTIIGSHNNCKLIVPFQIKVTQLKLIDNDCSY